MRLTDDGAVYLGVDDDGTGMRSAIHDAEPHHGLVIMQERAHGLGGERIDAEDDAYLDQLDQVHEVLPEELRGLRRQPARKIRVAEDRHAVGRGDRLVLGRPVHIAAGFSSLAFI